ncbi:MAG: hypothetical protein ACRC3B_13415 [Bacteroidia bacterium]
MSVESLRSYLRLQIDQADESLLRTLKNVLDEHSHTSEDLQFDLSEEEKKELSDQYKLLLKGEIKTYTEEELREQISKNRKSRKAG